MKFLRAYLFPFVLWIEVSLLAITFIGDRPYLSLAIAVLGGMVVGWVGVAGYSSPHKRIPIQGMGENSALLHNPLPPASGHVVQAKAGTQERGDTTTGFGAKARRVAEWIAEHELWLLAVPVTLMLFSNRLPIRIISASLWLIPIPWVCRWVAKGYLTAHTPMDLPIAVLLGMALIGLYPSVDPSMSMPVLYKMIVEFALFYGLINNLRTDKKIWVITSLLLVGGVGISMLALVNTDWITHKLVFVPQIYERLPRLLPQLNEEGFHPNIVGGTLAMLFPLHLFLFLFDSRRLWRLFLGLSLPLVGGTLLLTQSRGAIVGVVLALPVVGVWWSRWVLVSLPILSAGILWAVRHFGAQHVAEFLLITDATRTVAGRLEIWQRAIYMMQDFPFTGIGLGTFPWIASVMYPFFLIGPDTIVPQAHNLFLQTGVDLGMPGLVGLVALLTVFSITALETVRMAMHTELEPLAIGLTCGFVIYLIHGLVDNVTFSTKPGMMIWAIMGLIMALYHQHHERDLAR